LSFGDPVARQLGTDTCQCLPRQRYCA
jgi:hypothetical protein